MSYSFLSLFQNHPEFTGLKGLCQFLQFIPLSDEVLDFFKPVAGQIIQLLKGKSFLPTLSSGIIKLNQKLKLDVKNESKTSSF